ncbi:MAG: DUF6090 family protein [Verrucomicrobia bacterium]|nr:DUF6090 family protein [Verrucomicrobiota bacterium]MDA1066181.1 DUF6090 family protein [Verrucomicrobiota bacterium]
MKQSPFRSIRQTLFNEGKLLRYLGYAVGEIALIIIGIMLALQLNNWNEDRKAQAEFEVYILQLKEDVRKAIENANRVVSNSENRIDRQLRMVQFLEKKDYNADELEAFERTLADLGKQAIPQVKIGLLGQLLEGDMTIIKRDRKLSQAALELESAIDGGLRIIDHLQILDDQSNAIFLRYRTMTQLDVPELKLRYDLDALQASSEFIFAAENSTHNTVGIMKFSESMADRLESFLTVLEEYE